MALLNSNLLGITSTTPRIRAVRFLKEWILDGRLPVGEKLPPETRLAAKLNVSRATVRLALDDLEKEGVVNGDKRHRVVLSAIKPAQTFLSDAIALITDAPEKFQRTKILGTWHSNFIHTGAVDAIREAGYDVVHIHPSRIAGDMIQRLIVQRPRGVIILRKVLQTPGGQHLPQALREGNLPFVVYGDTGLARDSKKATGLDSVVSDHAHGAYELTKWLLSQGRRKILRLWTMAASGPSEKQEWICQRDLGHERALKEAGITPIPPLEIYDAIHDWSLEKFQLQVRLLVGYLMEYVGPDQPIDAIMAVSDSLVPGTAAALKFHHRVPNRDILIVGYDNMWRDLPVRELEPTTPAATVDKKNIEIGYELMRLLQERIEGSLPPEGQHRVIKPELVILPTQQES